MAAQAPQRTEIGQLGEFGLIERITQNFTPNRPDTIKGVGDDAAVLGSGNTVQVITTDMLLEGIHFDLSYMPLTHLGYKAVAVNISDVAAMNALPTQITVNLGLSNRFSVEAVEALYQGIEQACKDFKVDLVGGDTTGSASGLVISITALGQVQKEKVAYRKGANEGDILCVTGDLGGAYVGLQVLEREKQEFLENPEMQPQLDNYQYVVQRQLRPGARTDIIHELIEMGVVPTAMIDVSDGLASEVLHLCKQNNCGMRLYEDQLPIDKMTYDTAVEFKLDPITCVLNGGEDYELLFTIKQEDHETLKGHGDIHFIGYVAPVSQKAMLATKGGNLVPVQAQGWKHFD